MSPEKPLPTVYAARNPAMPGLIKIGKTSQDADSRLSQLYSTGVPVPFLCVCAISPERPIAEVEQALHAAFEPYRENPAREFFRITPAYRSCRLCAVWGKTSPTNSRQLTTAS